MQEAAEFLGEKLVVERVRQISGFELGLNRLGDGREPELAQIAVHKRIYLVSVGAIEKKRPLHRRGEEFAGSCLLLWRQLFAGQQQTEAIFSGQTGRHVLGHDIAEVAVKVGQTRTKPFAAERRRPRRERQSLTFGSNRGRRDGR